MGGLTPPGDGLTQLHDDMREFNRRLDNLERADGTSRFNLVSQVQAAIANIGASVTAFLSAGFTAASANITGNMIATNVYAINGPTTVHTGGRVAAWLLNANGNVGTATSSERFKDLLGAVLDDPDFDPLAVLDLGIEYWHYKDEVRKRDDPTFAGYVGPDYHVGTNFGPIAERAHELGLWMIVVYEREWLRPPVRRKDGSTKREGIDRLKLDGAGEPIPFGLHDSLFAYVLQMAVVVIRREQLHDRALLHRVAEKTGVSLEAE